MGPTERTASIVSRCRDAGVPPLTAVALQRYLTGARTLEWTTRYLVPDAPWVEPVALLLATEAAQLGGDERECAERMRALCAALPARVTNPDKLIAAYAKSGADAPWGALHDTLVALGTDRAKLHAALRRTGLPLVRDGALTELGRVLARAAHTHRDVVRGAFGRASDVVRALLAAAEPDLELAWSVALTAREMDLGVCVELLLAADPQRFIPFAVVVAGPDSLGDEVDRATALAALARHDRELAVEVARQVLTYEPVPRAGWRLAEPHATALEVVYDADPARFGFALAAALVARHPGLASAAVALLERRETLSDDERAALRHCVANGRAGAASPAARMLLASARSDAEARPHALAMREHPLPTVRAVAHGWLWTHAERAPEQAA